MKSLKPSHRESKRYLLLVGKDVSKKNIETAILDYIGALGFAQASPRVIKKTAKGTILAINRGALDKVRASFLVSEKDISVKKVAGGLRKVK